MACPIKVTSTFGEYRRDHFHGGVDFSTFGASGEPLLALAPCSVQRVRVDNRGYGNTLVLLHDDGYAVSYSHMKRFAPEIEACVRRMQKEQGHCLAEFYPPPDFIRFSPGDTVGRSGSSGVGPPHLHMEVVTPQGEAVNPLVGWYDVTDSVPPVFYRVVLSPLSADALVNGKPMPAAFRVRKVAGTQEWDVIGTPHVCGDIGLSVRAADRVHPGSDRVGVYRLRTEIDGDEVFRREYRSLPADQTKLVNLVYDSELQRRGFGRCERLYRLPGDHLRLHEASPGDGVVRAGPGGLGYGIHTVDVFLEDAAMNGAHLALPLVVNHPPEIVGMEWSGGDTVTVDIRDEHPEACMVTFSIKSRGRWLPAPSQPAGTHRWSFRRPQPGTLISAIARDEMAVSSRPYFWGCASDGGTDVSVTASYELSDSYVRITVASSRDLARAPDAFVSPGRLGFAPAVMWAEDERNYCMELLLFPQAAPGFRLLFVVEAIDGGSGKAELFVPLLPIAMAGESKVPSDDGCAWIEAGPDAVFRDSYLIVDTRALPPPPGLEPVTLGYRFSPESALLKRPVMICFRVPDACEGGDGLGIFQWVGTNGYRPLPGSYDASCRVLRAPTRTLGTFIVVRDPFPPTVGIVHRDGSSVPPRQTTSLRAYVTDRGSGVDRESVQMYLDGVTIPACPEGTAWVHRAATPLEPGAHTIRIEARDMVGNQAWAESRIMVE